MSLGRGKLYLVPRLIYKLRKIPSWLKSGLIIIVYTLIGLSLDFLSDQFESPNHLLPWYPTAGVHVALLLGFGWRYFPALPIVKLLDSLVVFPSKNPVWIAWAWALTVTIGYGVACAWLLEKQKIDPYLRQFRDALWFSFVAGFVAPLFVAVNGATFLAAAKVIPWSFWWNTTLSLMAGDATGVMMMAPPLLLLLQTAASQQNVRERRSLAKIAFNRGWLRGKNLPIWSLEMGSVMLACWLAYGLPNSFLLDYTYILFVPLLWIAVRHGLSRAVIAVLLMNFSAVLFVYEKLPRDVLPLQFGLMTASFLGVLTGAFISDLHYKAARDGLTRLYNRSSFMAKLRQAIAHSQQDPNYSFAVLMLDLDRFKTINDSLGHRVGDQLLAQSASRLKECLRSRDTVARFGGDEFIILLEPIDDVAQTRRIAQRICEELTETFYLDQYQLSTTVSIGIVPSTSDYSSPEDLLRNADIAMYHAKEKGRAQYAIFDDRLYEAAVEQSQLENDLRRAVKELDQAFQPQFLLNYQPIIDLCSGKISGFEALVRWQHPGRGMISPVQFISIAEDTGAIIPLGFWVLNQACAQVKQWQQLFPDFALTVAVNFSAKQFSQPNVVEKITQILEDNDFPADHLKLEITESVVMKKENQALEILKQLKDLNIQVSIDDFGTGYSSLYRLSSLSVDTLKIDRSFIEQVEAQASKFEMIKGIIGLAHSLNLKVIAEGIETAAQLAVLRALACEEGQGYFFSRPLGSQGIYEFLSAKQQFGTSN